MAERHADEVDGVAHVENIAELIDATGGEGPIGEMAGSPDGAVDLEDEGAMSMASDPSRTRTFIGGNQ